MRHGERWTFSKPLSEKLRLEQRRRRECPVLQGEHAARIAAEYVANPTDVRVFAVHGDSEVSTTIGLKAKLDPISRSVTIAPARNELLVGQRADLDRIAPACRLFWNARYCKSILVCYIALAICSRYGD
jgi:hypothetical protein